MLLQLLENLDLSGKTILEIGTGNSATTIQILEKMCQFPESMLITTDIVARNLTSLLKTFPDLKGRLKFIKTSAEKLEGIDANSVDIIVEEYSLCAINSQIGRVPLCFSRWGEVLKPGGILIIEEEYPIFSRTESNYRLWRTYWRFIKTLLIYAKQIPYHEIEPQILAQLLADYGFIIDHQEFGNTIIDKSELISAVSSHYSDWKVKISKKSERMALFLLKNSLIRQIKALGSMNTPYFSLKCHLGESRTLKE